MVGAVGTLRGGSIVNREAAPVEFVFDFVSPYAYLAYHRLRQIVQTSGHPLICTAVDLDALKARAGNSGPSTREQKLKFPYCRIDLQRWASLYGLPLHPPSGYGSARLNLGLPFARTAGLEGAYIDSVWAQIWGAGGDMTDERVLVRTADDIGLDPAELLEFVDSDEAERIYLSAGAAAHDQGVFGVPTVLWGEEMWWGNDRLHFVADALASRSDGRTPDEGGGAGGRPAVDPELAIAPKLAARA